MSFGLAIGTDRANALQKAIQDEIISRDYSQEADPVMAEYITIMIINNKTPAQINSELEDLIGSDFDPSFTDWLFAEAAKGAPGPAADSSITPAPAPAAANPASSSITRDPPPHAPSGPSGRPTTGAPRPGIYQAALNQATSAAGHKRTASARSPSPNGNGAFPNKSRRTDLPTGPRAMSGGAPPAGPRSLLDRVGGPGPRHNRHNNNNGGFGRDDIQARIDNITNGPMNGGMPDAAMMAQMGFNPAMAMGGMGMTGMEGANPLMLQEMMMNQMALMAQMASSMGILNQGAMNGFNGGGFPQGPGPDMGQYGGMGPQQGMNGHNNGMGGRGRGNVRGRGRGGGRGGAHQPSNDGRAPAHTPVSAPAAAPSAPVVAPVPVSAAAAEAAVARPGFVAPARPQSPTLCKFGAKCSNPVCRFSHPSPVATPESGIVLSNEACEKGVNCTDADCVKGHVSPAVKNGGVIPVEHQKSTPSAASSSQSHTPCRFGAGCTKQASGQCPFAHPKAASSGSSHLATTPCRFGSGCTRASCPFQHPEGRVLPTAFYRGLDGDAPLVSVRAPETGSIGAPNTSHNRSVTFNSSKGANTREALEAKVREIEERKREVAAKEAAAKAKKDDEHKAVGVAA